MKTFTIGQNLEIDVLRHVRVDGSRFPRPEPDSIADYFVINARWQGVPIDFYPNEGRRVDPLAFGFVGKKAQPVYDDNGNQVGTKRGGDFRGMRFWRVVARRLGKAVLARQLGKTVGQVTPDDEAGAGVVIRRLLTANFTAPADTRLMTIDDAARFLRDADGALDVGEKPPGTVADIDADFDSYVNSSGTESEGGTTLTVGIQTLTYRAQTRFSLASISTPINDVDWQGNVAGVSQVDAGDAVSWNQYGTSDPDTDSAATKYTNSGGTSYVTATGMNTTGSKTVDLGTTADTDVGNQVSSPGWFTVGIAPSTGFATPETFIFEAIENAGTDPATLTVDYGTSNVDATAVVIPVHATLTTAARLLTIAATPILVELAHVAATRLLAKSAAVISVEAASVAPSLSMTKAASVMSVQASMVAATGSPVHQRSATPISVDAAMVTAGKSLSAPATPIAVDATPVVPAKALAASASVVQVAATSVAPSRGLTKAASVMSVQAAMVEAVGFTGILRTATPISVEATQLAPSLSMTKTASVMSVEATMVPAARLLAKSATPISVDAAMAGVTRALSYGAQVIVVEALSLAPARLLQKTAAVIAVEAGSVAASVAFAEAASVQRIEAGMVLPALLLASGAEVITVSLVMPQAGQVVGGTQLATPILVEAAMVPATLYREYERVIAQLIGIDRATITGKGSDRATISAQGSERSTIRLKGEEP